jgi:hypothetical protein
MWSSLLAATGLLGSGIQAGALLMVLYGVCPTFREVLVPEWMRLHVSLDRSIERYMPAINISTGGATLVLLFFAQAPEVRVLRALALVCNVALALMSELVNVRINKSIARKVAVLAGGVLSGGPDDPTFLTETGDWERDRMVAVRERWIRWHQWRTLDIVLGFGLSVAAVLVAGR